MAKTKNDLNHYRKVEKSLRAGSVVKVNGNIGRVLTVATYPKPQYDYKTASVRFYNPNLKSRHYSIGSLELCSHHRENLYTKLTGKRISDKDLVDFCVGLQQLDSLKQYSRFIENYYLRNRSKKETARKLGVSANEVKKLKKDFIKTVKEHNYDTFILSALPISLEAPIESRIDNVVTLRYLKKRGKFTLGDIKNLERPDLFKGIDKVDRYIVEKLWKDLNNLGGDINE